MLRIISYRSKYPNATQSSLEKILGGWKCSAFQTKGLTTIKLYLDKHEIVKINSISEYHCHQLNPLSKISVDLVSEIS